jgi:SNF2 family DNA or RNA helicase
VDCVLSAFCCCLSVASQKWFRHLLVKSQVNKLILRDVVIFICNQREEIYLMLQRDPAAKAIIFSQFTSMLDLIGFALQKVFILVIPFGH